MISKHPLHVISSGYGDASDPLAPGLWNRERAMNQLKQMGFFILGLDERGDTIKPADNKDQRLALVMGAEGKGLRRLTRESCDHLIHIPMAGDVSSLNVSVAGGICLFEAVRQRAV